MAETVRDALVQRLGRAMSDVSEECWYAGWLLGTESLVPELCRRAAESGSAQPWGHGEITPALARELIDLAGRIGAWAGLHPEEERYIPHQPFPVPVEHLASLDRELQIQRTRSHREGPA